MTNKKISTPAKIFTIGFMTKSAETFFELLELHGITEVIDVRLSANSHLYGYTKATDLKFFLKRISSIEYRQDLKFAPPEEIFKKYRQKLITREEYAAKIEYTLQERRIVQHILTNYSDSPEVRYCLLGAEVNPVNCHRILAAGKFAEVYGMEIVNL